MNTDSCTGKAKEYIDAILQYRLTDIPQTLHYSRLLLSYARKQDDAALTGTAFYYLGEAYYLNSDNSKALSSILDAAKFSSQTSDYFLLAHCYNLMGMIYDSQGNISSAMEQYFTALSFCRKCNYFYMEGVLRHNIAATYQALQDYPSAARHFRAALSLYKKAKNKTGYTDNLFLCYSSLGQCLCMQGKLEQAGKIQRKLESLLASRKDTRYLAAVYLFLIHYYQLCGNAAQVDSYISICLEHAKADGPLVNQSDDYQNLFRLYLDMQRYDDFLELFSVVNSKSGEQKSPYANFLNHQIWVSYLKAAGQTEEYYQALEQYYELSERQALAEKKNSYNNMKICFAYDKALRRQQRLEKKGEQLRLRSEIDEMTGLPNRFRLNDYLEEVFERAYKEQSSLAIEILDIDFFKQYNDTYGHIAGDECLKMLAGELKAMSSPDVFCARYGGDEFIIIYTHKSQEEVLTLAEQLKGRILAHRQPHAASAAAPYVTISQGISWRIPKESNRVWDYLHVADQALYYLKKNERNAVKIYA